METSPIPPTATPLSDSDKLVAVLCHVSALIGIGYFIVPLIVYLVMRDKSPVVAGHAKEVLNFHISLLIYSVCLLPLFFLLYCLLFPVYAVLAVGVVVCSIIGAIRAYEGGFFFYPLTIRFIR